MNSKISLRPAGAADQPFLFELFRATRAGRFDFQPGGHPQMPVMVRLQFEAQEAALASRYPGSDHCLILLDGAPVGRLRVARDETGLQLADISILPGFQRKRIGTAVMEDLMEKAQQAKVPIRSMVAQGDQALLDFYRKLRFEVTRQDAAYVLLKWLPS